MCLRHKDSFKTVRDIDELKLQSARVHSLEGKKKIEHIDIWAPIYNYFPWKKKLSQGMIQMKFLTTDVKPHKRPKFIPLG